MSKIVGLRLHLKAPTIIAASMAPLLRDHPQLHRLLAQADKQVFITAIRNIAKRALGSVAEAWNGRIENYVFGHGNDQKTYSYEGKAIVAAIISEEITRGCGIVVNDEGWVEFVGLELNAAVKNRLKADFTTAFSCMATQDILRLCGYQTTTTKPTLVDASAGGKKLQIAVKGVRS